MDVSSSKGEQEVGDGEDDEESGSRPRALLFLGPPSTAPSAKQEKSEQKYKKRVKLFFSCIGSRFSSKKRRLVNKATSTSDLEQTVAASTPAPSHAGQREEILPPKNDFLQSGCSRADKIPSLFRFLTGSSLSDYEPTRPNPSQGKEPPGRDTQSRARREALWRAGEAPNSQSPNRKESLDLNKIHERRKRSDRERSPDGKELCDQRKSLKEEEPPDRKRPGADREKLLDRKRPAADREKLLDRKRSREGKSSPGCERLGNKSGLVGKERPADRQTLPEREKLVYKKRLSDKNELVIKKRLPDKKTSPAKKRLPDRRRKDASPARRESERSRESQSHCKTKRDPACYVPPPSTEKRHHKAAVKGSIISTNLMWCCLLVAIMVFAFVHSFPSFLGSVTWRTLPRKTFSRQNFEIMILTLSACSILTVVRKSVSITTELIVFLTLCLLNVSVVDLLRFGVFPPLPWLALLAIPLCALCLFFTVCG